MAFDEGHIYEAYQGLEREDAFDVDRIDRATYLQNFKDFILKAEPQVDRDKKGNQLYYLTQLTQNKTYISVDLEHVRTENRELAAELEQRPAELLPLFEEAAVLVLTEHFSDTGDTTDTAAAIAKKGVQVLLYCSGKLSQSQTASIRDLAADAVNKLVMVTGIVTAASKPKNKASSLTVQCKTCKGTLTVACKPGMGGALIPSICKLKAAQAVGQADKCEMNPYVVLPDSCSFVDQQQLKLQEKPEDVPTGEMPRSVTLLSDRQLVGRVTPGTRVTVLGIYSAHKGSRTDKNAPAALQQPYIRIVSLAEDAGDSHSKFNFTQQEIADFERFAQQEKVHNRIFSWIAPNIYGSEEIKKAVAALLFGGSRKTLPDGTARRGDINVLLLGDPSTAKSQFLKFAFKVAPISVYTSGKGSSAAGLTASVIQEPGSREFYLEGGAMVLADNGVVCIDEFDKMRPEDRVAIHEAMEQQTISIAKAGITTMLKSRTSVLAAANPPSGRYDDLKSAQDNMDLQSTILSRFDLIFIVKDPATEERDNAIARKVLENHRLAGAVRSTAGTTANADAAVEVEFLKRYVHYCRSQCSPRLSDSAQERLAAYYVEVREEARKAAERDDTDVPPVPVTVRQLEALIRISEAFAKMQLQTTATLEHVEMAIELFRFSTMDAVKSGVATYNVASDPQRAAIHRIEDKIRRRVHIGGYLTTRRLLDELVALGDPESLVMRALCALDAQGEFQLRRERSVVHRIR